MPEAAPPSESPAPAAFTCGGATCAADELCESRFKGHATDDEGRPLDRMKCMPIPSGCEREPTCACVTAQLSATHCTDDGGQVRIDDFPG